MANTNSTKTTASGSTGAAGGYDETYYKTHYTTQPYVVRGMDYDADYAPAYRYGVEVSEAGKFDEATARSTWDKIKGKSRLTFDQAMPAIRDAMDRVIQLREERLNVSKESVQTGEASIRKEVRTEHKQVTVPVEHEELVIERRAVNKTVAGGIDRADAETIKVPLKAEKVVVSKDTVVTEEVSVGKKKVAGKETVTADLKREELVVDQDVKSKTSSSDTTRKSK